MNDDARPFDPSPSDDLAAGVEDAIDEKRAGILAADATGMVLNEQFITVTELREGDVTPEV